MLNSAQSAFQAAIALWLSQGVPWTVCKFTSQANDLEISNGEDRFVHRLKSFCPKPLIKFGSLLGKKGEAEEKRYFFGRLCSALHCTTSCCHRGERNNKKGPVCQRSKYFIV